MAIKVTTNNNLVKIGYEQGPSGATGATGVGSPGATGATGAGATGATGPVGATGPANTDAVAPTISSNIVVNLPNGGYFGKYKNGDTIIYNSEDPQNALDLILDALNEAGAPNIVSFSSTDPAFNSTAGNLTVSYNVQNLNTGATLTVQVYRKAEGASDDTYSLVHTNTTASSSLNTSFSDSYTLPGFSTTGFTYKLVASDDYPSSGTDTAFDTVTPSYSPPTFSSSLTANRITNSSFSGENSNNREIGNYDSTVVATVQKNSSLVDISEIKLERSVDGGAWATLVTETDGSTSFSYTDNSNSGLTAVGEIEYRLTVKDDYIDTGGASPVVATYTVSFNRYPVLWGASSTLVDDNSNDASLVSVYNAIRSSALSVDKRLRSSSGLSNEIFDGNAQTNNVSNWTFVAFPNSYGTFTQVLDVNNADILNDQTWYRTGYDTLLSAGSFDIVNDFGETISMKMYRTNDRGAFGVSMKAKITT